MGKTFVALAIAYSVAVRSPQGPVIVMVPPNLMGKWEQDLKTFCELYLDGRVPVNRDGASNSELRARTALRYGVARHSVAFMRLLDDSQGTRCHLILLAQGALGRSQSDKWVRLALIAEALRKHARGKARKLIAVRRGIHRFLGELLYAIGEERSHGWGNELWEELLRSSPKTWKDVYNGAVRNDSKQLADDPVPKSISRALQQIDLRELAEELSKMPVRAVGGDSRVSERLKPVRDAIYGVEHRLWAKVLREAKWRSPLLVMDEAHHLKNPKTLLARQLRSHEIETDLKVGDGAMANSFDRMLFLTATPFQLGHHELVSVLERFGDVRWNHRELGEIAAFKQRMSVLGGCLDRCQRSAIALQRAWAKLRQEDCTDPAGQDLWWQGLLQAQGESLTHHQRAVVEAFRSALVARNEAQEALRPWVVRHDKGEHWAGVEQILRRRRWEGAAIGGDGKTGGLPVPQEQLLPFFLAARSAVRPAQDLLGEALSSSYEAFRDTRRNRKAGRDEVEGEPDLLTELSRSGWYLAQFDNAVGRSSGANHPKVAATVKLVVDLWERGEKVLVFAFYRLTCRALRVQIGAELEKRLWERATQALTVAGGEGSQQQVDRVIKRAQRRYFDVANSPARKALDGALLALLNEERGELDRVGVTPTQIEELLGVMRRFLRVPTTLVRCFPLAALDTIAPAVAVEQTLHWVDGSDISWRTKLTGFIRFLCRDCSMVERVSYLAAASKMQTGNIRVDAGEDGRSVSTTTLANVQEATGVTARDARERLMRAFNTPFFPDILVCSEVMGEGVDLQRSCRYVIHHDLSWNPSTIEQRTGRIDRLGCKAEGKHAINVYLPYLAGAADERQFQVMSERERWFRVVMGQEEVAKLITPDSSNLVPLPKAVVEALKFSLSL
jgi:hypothetical protein